MLSVSLICFKVEKKGPLFGYHHDGILKTFTLDKFIKSHGPFSFVFCIKK